MVIKVTKVDDNNSHTGYSVAFKAEIDGVEIFGTASNVRRSEELLEKYNKTGAVSVFGSFWPDQTFGVRLILSNKGVSKHPEYQEIRTKLIRQILMIASAQHTTKWFPMGAGLKPLKEK